MKIVDEQFLKQLEKNLKKYRGLPEWVRKSEY